MKSRNLFVVSLTLPGVVLAALLAGPPGLRAAWPDNHLDVADIWLAQITPANNNYGTPASIYYDDAGQLHAQTMCGSFVALLLRNAYPTVTGAVLDNLTGSPSPNAAQWYDAFAAHRTYTTTSGTFAMHTLTNLAAVQPGMILASKYTVGGATGHVMVVDAIVQVDVDEWLVTVIDSTSSVHGNYAGSTESRYAAGDTGIGSGHILLYGDAQNNLVGWTWNVQQTTPYQTTDPAGANYRPMVVGYLTGPGL